MQDFGLIVRKKCMKMLKDCNAFSMIIQKASDIHCKINRKTEVST